MRVMLWPRRSFGRSLRYFYKRVLRIAATPHAIAAGVAAGVFASFQPFLGFHILLAAILAWMMAGNIVASVLGTTLANPLTFPFIWGSTYETGRLILQRPDSVEHDAVQLGSALLHLDFVQLWEPLLKPMTVGALPIGLGFALLFYMVTRWAASAFRNDRRERLLQAARRRASAGKPVAG